MVERGGPEYTTVDVSRGVTRADPEVLRKAKPAYDFSEPYVELRPSVPYVEGKGMVLFFGYGWEYISWPPGDKAEWRGQVASLSGEMRCHLYLPTPTSSYVAVVHVESSAGGPSPAFRVNEFGVNEKTVQATGWGGQFLIVESTAFGWGTPQSSIAGSFGIRPVDLTEWTFYSASVFVKAQ